MTVDEIYALIGQNISNSLSDDEWDKAALFIEAGDDYAGFDGEFYANGVKYYLDVHRFDSEVAFALMELHGIMTPEDGSDPWNRAVFALLPSGEFNVEFRLEEEENEE